MCCSFVQKLFFFSIIADSLKEFASMITSVEDERERMVILFSSRMTINIIIVMIIIILNQESQATKSGISQVFVHFLHISHLSHLCGSSFWVKLFNIHGYIVSTFSF